MILLRTKVLLILEVWWYLHFKSECCMIYTPILQGLTIMIYNIVQGMYVVITVHTLHSYLVLKKSFNPILFAFSLSSLNYDDEGELDEESGKICAANRIFNVDNEILVNESGKMVFLIQLLDNLKQNGHRCLVFSQSRKVLDILQKVLRDQVRFWSLTHCGLVTPYGDRDLGQHWLRLWLVACRHQAITWTNVDWSSVKSIGIHIRAFSQELPQPSITKICLKEKSVSKISSKFPRVQWVNSLPLRDFNEISNK